MNLKIKKLYDDAIIPTRAHITDAGLDLYSCENDVIIPHGRRAIGTGLAIALPPNHAGFVQPRSGLALEKGVTVLNTPGLVDEGYRGEVKVILYNSSVSYFNICKGMRIAQLVIVQVSKPTIVETDNLSVTDRGHLGFGSTGIEVI